MIVTSIQDSKPHEKQISPTFSYFLINNAQLLYHFLANLLAHNKKMTEKSVFREAWNPELTSQSFPADEPKVHLTGYKNQRCSISGLTCDQMNFSAIDYFLS